MLSLLLILSGLGLLTPADHYSETSHLQITVPQKLGTTNNDVDVFETHVIYAIQINRETYTLHLEKQSFVDPQFLVYSYNKLGKLYPDSSVKKGHCFYQGYAAEIPNSVVTLSTCSGLRGLLQLENVSYGIEPLESTAMYEHMLYQINNNKADFLPLQDNYPMIHLGDQAYRILVKSEKKLDELLQRTLKIKIIMDKALFDYMGSEVAVAAEKIVHIFGLINTMFSQLKVTVMLTSLEIWSDQNKILSTGDANEVLKQFVSWKEQFLLQRSHDLTFLLIYRDHPNYVGATYHGRACDPKLAAGIALYPKRISLEAFSVVMAQLLGINLGLSYDDIYNCYCPGTSCIMNPQTIRSRGVKFFSSCSVDEFKRVVSQPEFECLQNQAVSKVVVQGREPICGNGVVDPGEQCDCGSPETCEFKKCCDLENCTLIGLAECGNGACCNKKTCRVNKRGHICRKSVDPCDFTEFCSGTSQHCVPDMKALDLELCNNRTAYCYKGTCQDVDKQCAELFGKFAKGATYLCAQEVNAMGDKFGHCGSRWCQLSDAFCAKLVCHWTRTQISTVRNYDIQYTYIGGHVCMSAYNRSGTRTMGEDVTYITDGTKCDDNKFCHQGSCQNISLYRDLQICDAKKKCGGHGVCNTNFNCQCDKDFYPPNCDPLESSQGGSIDDGFWIISRGKVVNLPINEQHAGPQKNGLLISFYIFLPFLILIAIIILKRIKVNIWNREGTVSEGSMSEGSISNSNMSNTELKQ